MCLLQSLIRLRRLLWRLTLFFIMELPFKAFLVHTGVSVTGCSVSWSWICGFQSAQRLWRVPGLWDALAAWSVIPLLTLRQWWYWGIVSIGVAVCQLVSALNRNCSKEIHRTCWGLQELLWNNFCFKKTCAGFALCFCSMFVCIWLLAYLQVANVLLVFVLE